MSTGGFAAIPIDEVAEYWNARPSNIRHSPKPLGTREYFNEVERRKYFVEPHIPKFAEFDRWQGKRVLEIGCGIGTDTMNFARHGAQVTAVDISEQSVGIARRRAEVFALEDRIRFYVGNAEELSDFVPVEAYDLVYSFGVIHHTPHPDHVIRQIGRYLRPGGTLKVMVYHRRSWKVLNILLARGHGRFWALDEILAAYSEAQTGFPAHTHISLAISQCCWTDFGSVTSGFITSSPIKYGIMCSTGTERHGVSGSCRRPPSGGWNVISGGTCV